MKTIYHECKEAEKEGYGVLFNEVIVSPAYARNCYSKMEWQVQDDEFIVRNIRYCPFCGVDLWEKADPKNHYMIK